MRDVCVYARNPRRGSNEVAKLSAMRDDDRSGPAVSLKFRRTFTTRSGPSLCPLSLAAATVPQRGRR
jgi:hypothetical protein